MNHDFEEIVNFWLGDAPGSAEALEQRKRMWFRADPELDVEIELRFGGILARQAAGVSEKWKVSPRGRLGLIILFDQFPRNIHRGSAKAFALDSRALDLCQSGIDAGLDRALKPLERMFFYMPLQHAEALGTQDRSVEMFEALAASCPAEQRAFFDQALGYAREHRELIARFGRFPHRNRVLGRVATAEETAYLEGGGATFGQ